jgi:hypothetical protein
MTAIILFTALLIILGTLALEVGADSRDTDVAHSHGPAL